MRTSDSTSVGLSPQQRASANALLDELLDLPEAQRMEHLRDQRIEDPMVAAEVESLLRAASASEGFLSEPGRPHAPPADARMAIGTRLGPWRIDRLIGCGGMGDVYEATRAEGDFEQTVAIKILQRDALAQFERFLAERQLLARFSHPGIARLLDGSVTEDQRPFMVMEYVEGRTITEYCRLEKATLEERLTLFAQVCDAVAYAHQHLVVHRDLKPANILVTTDRTVKLLDFGIAKLLDPLRARTTQHNPSPLTPSCAAPEQLIGGPITTATDVYALGVLLFELLTGSHPWIGSDEHILHAMRMVLRRPAPLASDAAESTGNAPVPVRRIRGDLDAITAKALREEPAHRYTTVAGLKADIERVLVGEPVEARNGARLYVFGRTLRRYRWLVAVSLLPLVAASGILAWQTHQATLARDLARREASRAEAVRSNLTRLLRAPIADHEPSSASPDESTLETERRTLRTLHSSPEVAGQAILTPTNVYGAMEDVTGVASLLEAFVAQPDPQMDPAALAEARQKLANLELVRGQTEYASQLLGQAAAFWASSPRPYLEERLDGMIAQARLERARGDLEAAIAASRASIAQRITLSGHDHRETAILYNLLAICLADANRTDQAIAAYREATAIYRALGLGEALDAQIVLANNGILELQLGHPKVAEALLTGALARERALAGDSVALGTAMGYYGRLLSATNRDEAAVSVLREAVEVAVRSGGVDSPLAMQNTLFLGAAQASAGRREEAIEALNDVHVAALTQFGASHPLELLARVQLAELAAAGGEIDRARVQLESAVALLRKSGLSGEASLARALQDLGEIELGVGHRDEASAALREAVALREKISGDGWELAQARERWGEALARSGSPLAMSQLIAAAHGLELQLGTNHPEAMRARAAIAQARGLPRG